jgi:hypothetical protein
MLIFKAINVMYLEVQVIAIVAHCEPSINIMNLLGNMHIVAYQVNKK